MSLNCQKLVDLTSSEAICKTRVSNIRRGARMSPAKALEKVKEGIDVKVWERQTVWSDEEDPKCGHQGTWNKT